MLKIMGEGHQKSKNVFLVFLIDFPQCLIPAKRDQTPLGRDLKLQFMHDFLSALRASCPARRWMGGEFVLTE